MTNEDLMGEHCIRPCLLFRKRTLIGAESFELRISQVLLYDILVINTHPWLSFLSSLYNSKDVILILGYDYYIT